MTPQVFTLKNGLQVIFVDTKSTSLTTILLVGAGSRYENEKNNGIAHFFEHMAFKGSKKYPNSFLISSTIEGIGGIFNAFTSKDHTGYWIKSTLDHFETVIDVISDMVLNPILSGEEIEREKGVIVEEINMYEDMPQRRVGELFEGLLYKGNPLGYDIAGTKETVQSFDRLTFVEYIKNLYHPENAVLVVAGGLGDKSQISNLKSQINSKFENWKNDKHLSFKPIIESQTKPQMLIKYKKTEQAHFSLGFRAFSFKDNRKYALNVLSAILGGGMSSRLFIQVRERRGLCYYISTGSELYSDCGNIVTQAGVTNDLGKVKEAIKIILEEHQKIADRETTKNELKRAKELIKGRFLLSLEDSANVASSFGVKKLLQNKVETPEEIIKKIENVTVDEITNLAKEAFTQEKLNFAMIGPFKEGDLQIGK
ncbi:MAG: Peptidase M16 domain protein [Candidatus Roizmanbacteria bacterium GW2011_GWC2_37_13]|uniref:Peptidase M16 domain protein n=1 Tax=Candidatus Roizmanbacteria bacterium GW2011_GWC2_37_13 TaxID=1618486 RepID=A0A0G0ILQ0_9BACT|nr:MAG: Peptidase M16 domain protein [Candidatus Roizmanbacteria bacterium GW2011_GWC1_37_12]KKQ25124.1 MAG: Peptidase M16 domain protein [Candidatus Roizmanbacteria bacterium GW2011_GWC2_37_13]